MKRDVADGGCCTYVSIVEGRSTVGERQRKEMLLMEDVVHMWTVFELNYVFITFK